MEIKITLSDVFAKTENVLLDYAILGRKLNITEEGFRACVFIFSQAMMDRMWDLQQEEKMDIKDRCNMAKAVGEDIRKLVKIYTNLDTFDLYEKDGSGFLKVPEKGK